MATEKTVKMVVIRDYWDADAERVNAGTILHLPVEDAMAGMESGAMRRATDADK